MTVDEVRTRFLELHERPRPLLAPNPWDIGSARLLASLGFEALATTSSGIAGTLGQRDGSLSGEESLASVAAIASAVDVPVSADLEDGFGDAPDVVADTIRGAVATDLAGASIEDWSREGHEIHDMGLAVERIAAAAEAAHAGPVPFVLTARAENHIRGRDDLDDTIARLQAFQEAGADVLYTPGLMARADIEAVVAAVDRPVNVIVRPGGPTVDELAAWGVRRISVGGALSNVAVAAVAGAARELLGAGTVGFLDAAVEGRVLAGDAYA